MKIKLLSTFLFASVALFAQHNETKKIIKIQGNDTTVIMINGRIDKMDSLLTEEMKTIYLILLYSNLFIYLHVKI